MNVEIPETFSWYTDKSLAVVIPKVVIPVTLRVLTSRLSIEVGPKTANLYAVTIPLKYASVPVRNPTVVTPVTYKEDTIPNVETPETLRLVALTWIIVLPILISLVVSSTLTKEPNWDNSLLFAIT